MNLPASRPITYAISSGEATDQNFKETSAKIVSWVEVAVECRISLVQLREKKLSARLLTSLATRAVEISRGSSTGIMINDRADVASAAGADGVHLTSNSLRVNVVRKNFPELLIAVSTHSIEEVAAASVGGADLVVFGPVFDTPGKAPAKGLGELGEICRSFPDLPVIGLGGIERSNSQQVLDAGAAGIAAIRAFGKEASLREMTELLKL